MEKKHRQSNEKGRWWGECPWLPSTYSEMMSCRMNTELCQVSFLNEICSMPYRDPNKSWAQPPKNAERPTPGLGKNSKVPLSTFLSVASRKDASRSYFLASWNGCWPYGNMIEDTSHEQKQHCFQSFKSDIKKGTESEEVFAFVSFFQTFQHILLSCWLLAVFKMCPFYHNLIMIINKTHCKRVQLNL